MSLPKKHSRTIEVDGHCYHWMASRARQAIAHTVNLVIELADQPKQRLIVSVPCRDFWLDFPHLDFRDIAERRQLTEMDEYRPVTPRTVEQVIRAAMIAGWNPSCPGKPFKQSLVR